MKQTPCQRLEAARKLHPLFGSPYGAMWGFFALLTASRAVLYVISSGPDDGTGWEHVSVTVMPQGRRVRCPSWPEMCMVKSLFWEDEETVIQFHPTSQEYVNEHPYCLHLWKRFDQDFELPPRELLA